MPELKKAELINGMVFLAADYRGRILDRSIPRLENGDHLTRAEFERRWDNMPDLKKAELINGMVFMSPPVSASNHGIPHSKLMLWLGQYWLATSVIAVSDNSTWRVPIGDDEPQPDATVFVLPEFGGKAGFDKVGCVTGTPEFVAEIAASSVTYDTSLKRDLYARNGVKEFLVWHIYDGQILWFKLNGAQYELMTPGADGILRSQVLPGLWLDANALLRGDLSMVARTVQAGTSSPEHSKFIAAIHSANDSQGQ